MKDGLEIYKTWAPDGALWTQWAKPVLFHGMNYSPYYGTYAEPDVGWLGETRNDTAIILDLPGAQGIEQAAALAKKGYRPVPLYNGTRGPSATAEIVDVASLSDALAQHSYRIEQASLSPGAPPVFMLDSRRLPFGVGKMPSMYDNRWCVFPQDMPSAAYLLKHGIRYVIVRSGEGLQVDLMRILRRWQEQGVKIYLSAPAQGTQEVSTADPSRLKNSSRLKIFSYRFRTMLKLTRNAAGGFGGKVPEMSGGGYYGYG